MADMPSEEPGLTYRELDMQARLKPEQFEHYRKMSLDDQLVVAHYVNEGLGFPLALLKLSQLKQR